MSVQSILGDPNLLRWVVIVSSTLFVAVLILIPLIVVGLPATYFLPSRRGRTWLAKRHPLIWVPMMVLKNLLGLVCVCVGIILLFLPGQGILTILVGILLLDFPGKYRIERWLIKSPTVFAAINRVREVAGKQPFVYDDKNTG